MGASPTIYCLENITDYLEFERLCDDLLALEGYSSIEPLGGFGDKGRDAIHVDISSETTIFAYSVREDWRAKLAEDTSKIHSYGHTCDHLIFITTARFSVSERDQAIGFVRDEYGWKLELYGVERLRILLDAQHPEVKQVHPQIFPPQFLTPSTESDTPATPDHLFMSYVLEDRAFADWLMQKLTAEGYLVWSEHSQLLGGETYLDDVDSAITNQTLRFIGLYSKASLKNPEVMRQRTLALNIGKEGGTDFLIPLNVDGVTEDQLDRLTRSLKFIPFEENWAQGLEQLLEKLESIDCPRPLYNGRSLAAEASLGRDVLVVDPRNWTDPLVQIP